MKIKAQNFSVKYQDEIALQIEDAQIEGNVIAVIGHNGAGKSTFIKSVLGLLPYKGSLSIHSDDELLSADTHMSFCPETGSVFADISVESYVRLWCRFKQSDVNYYKKQGSSIVELLELEPLFKKLGRELSKGQRRRVQTAIGFLSQPKLFLFDEPFDGLDVQKTRELMEIMKSFKEKMNFIVSSHRMDVIERLADTVVVLSAGKIVCVGEVAQVSKQLCEKAGVTTENPSLVDAMDCFLANCS